jgi:hypothetical protein
VEDVQPGIPDRLDMLDCLRQGAIVMNIELIDGEGVGVFEYLPKLGPAVLKDGEISAEVGVSLLINKLSKRSALTLTGVCLGAVHLMT